MLGPMKIPRWLSVLTVLVALADATATRTAFTVSGINRAQVPKWSGADLEFFLHGSMGTEVVPERVLRAFISTYPDLFSKQDLSNFGLITNPTGGLPVGVSRREVPHLGRLSSIGVNCAACHVGEVHSPAGQRVRVLGMTAQFDAEAFFDAVIVATFRTANPANMEKFLSHYWPIEPAVIERQRAQIVAAIQEDPTGAKGAGPGGLQLIEPEDLRADAGNPAPAVRALLKLFHNMRAALHIPDQPPPPSPPNGPGRNDPWRVLSYSLLGIVTKPAPVKFGIVWNEDRRQWVHFDGNTRSPIVRNLAASLGLGAPLIGQTGDLDFALIQRHTALSEIIRPPRYPWAIDRAAAKRGAKIYRANCASCHNGPESDQRLHAISEIKTDPNRAEIFTPDIAERFNKFFTDLQIPGYRPPEKPLRGTQKYWSPDLAGVWARAPYLHNGSVRTMRELLMPPEARQKQWHRGTRLYDHEAMGYADDGAHVLDTTGNGHSNAGHDYGNDLSDAQKRELIEYLKTL